VFLSVDTVPTYLDFPHLQMVCFHSRMLFSEQCCIIASECTFAGMWRVACECHDDGGIVLVLYCYVLI